MAVLEQNLEPHVRGDSYAFPVEFLANDMPQDMTDWVLWFTVKHHPMQPDEDAVLQKVVTVTGTSAVISVAGADTQDLPPVNFYYDIQLVSSTGDAVQTLVQGRWQLRSDVTVTHRVVEPEPEPEPEAPAP
ncbi:hypothetical protein [Endozoicomonas ascidiicola]|uniref:hypothetical protein n=1 Tax=Endozoicomonas ascidiicola TaxID=1698521 RepID=UPI0008296FCC|nr:hypothetical protein [Endozoicomonas ascidiicola]